MEIVVCLKQVPARDAALRLNDSGDWIADIDISPEMNEPDSYALEEALRLKEQHGGSVTAISAGPAEAASALREALAKGADSAILVEEAAFQPADPLVTARALAKVIERQPFDLVLTGLQSDDAGYGQVGVILAELLGAPHAAIVVEVEAAEAELTVKQELESGWFQRVRMPTPAVLTIQSGINKVRYATLMGIKKARKKPLERLGPADIGVNLEPAQRIAKLYSPARSKHTQMLEGSAKEQAQALVEKLRHEARAL